MEDGAGGSVDFFVQFLDILKLNLQTLGTNRTHKGGKKGKEERKFRLNFYAASQAKAGICVHVYGYI